MHTYLKFHFPLLYNQYLELLGIFFVYQVNNDKKWDQVEKVNLEGQGINCLLKMLKNCN